MRFVRNLKNKAFKSISRFKNIGNGFSKINMMRARFGNALLRYRQAKKSGRLTPMQLAKFREHLIRMRQNIQPLAKASAVVQSNNLVSNPKPQNCNCPKPRVVYVDRNVLPARASNTAPVAKTTAQLLAERRALYGR